MRDGASNALESGSAEGSTHSSQARWCAHTEEKRRHSMSVIVQLRSNMVSPVQ